MKQLRWMGSSYKRLLEFPKTTIRQIGYQLGKVQRGEEPVDWKPMSSIGPGAVEIRIHDPQEHRVIYVAKFDDAVYVLHTFEKKTQKTAEKDLNIARTAYAELKKMTQKTVNGVTFLEGTDNIYRDLGFPEAKSVNLLARAELMMTIEKTIKERGLTQSEAAKLLGVSQPRLSDLYKGKLEKFTIDMLVKWLSKLGKQVTISVADQDVA